jgi:hypothetical protein
MGCAQVNATSTPETPSNGKKLRIRNNPRRQDLHTDNITEEFSIISDKLTDEQLSYLISKLVLHPLFCTLSKR